MSLIIKNFWARLAAAIIIPIFLVTGALFPIVTFHWQERVDSTRLNAETLLESEYDLLLQNMNESFNQVLATAEFPLLRRFLARQKNLKRSKGTTRRSMTGSRRMRYLRR